MHPNAIWGLALGLCAGACSFSDAGLERPDAASDASVSDAGDAGFDARPDAAPCGALGEACCAAEACGAELSCVPGRCGCIGKLSAGASHTCVLEGTRKVLCWGKNDSAQLGDG